MDVKQCECDALKLLSRLCGTYGYFITAGSLRASKNMEVLFNEISAHLETQLARPEYQGKDGESTRKRMERAWEARRKYNNANLALDDLKDGIHQDTSMRQLFLCGEPGNESQLTKKVFDAIDIMSQTTGGPEDAEEAFDKLYSEHTCESAEEEEE